MELLTRRLVSGALTRIGMSGAGIETVALASVRATREATVKHGGEDLPVISGTPIDGEIIDGERFDGKRRTAVFPGDLPKDPETLFDSAGHASLLKPGDFTAVRFRPPELGSAAGLELTLPHIRLDRAIEFLIGDRLA